MALQVKNILLEIFQHCKLKGEKRKSLICSFYRKGYPKYTKVIPDFSGGAASEGIFFGQNAIKNKGILKLDCFFTNNGRIDQKILDELMDYIYSQELKTQPEQVTKQIGILFISIPQLIASSLGKWANI